MNILLLVNQFCRRNNFFPTTLYGTKNKITIEYSSSKRREYNKLLKAICNSKVFNNVHCIFDPVNNRILVRGK